MNYIASHNPATVMQIARCLQIDRAQVYRILRAAYGPNFRQRWPHGATIALDGPQPPLAA